MNAPSEQVPVTDSGSAILAICGRTELRDKKLPARHRQRDNSAVVYGGRVTVIIIPMNLTCKLCKSHPVTHRARVKGD